LSWHQYEAQVHLCYKAALGVEKPWFVVFSD